MNRVSVCTPRPPPLGLIEERYIIRGLGVDVLESHIHRTNRDAHVLESGEEKEEVMGRQRKLGGLNVRRREIGQRKS